jgi:glyoxylase-like metal-dependent hydrolase (beta-lactamase superfamily II)
MRTVDFPSRHYQLTELEQGIYAAIARPGGWAAANAGLVDLGDSALVFDTGLTPHAADDLRAAAETLLKKPVSLVINSHAHSDHTWGNQAFPPSVEIIASVKTRQQMASASPETIHAVAAEAYRRHELSRPNIDSPNRLARLEAAYWSSYAQALGAAIPALEIRLPDLTFAGRLQIHRRQGEIELATFDFGHSSGDSILLLHRQRIAFMGDLLSGGCHPRLEGSHPAAWIEVLRGLDVRHGYTLVPGCGPVSTAGALTELTGYLETVRDLAGRYPVTARPEHFPAIPAAFAGWELPGRWPENLAYAAALDNSVEKS